jgi:hypothetical protein
MSYLENFRGRFIGLLRWDDCDELLEILKSDPSDWYVYDTLTEVPDVVLTAELFLLKLAEMKEILVADHKGKRCGTVFTNDLNKPTFVKIFNPNNLGKVCGGSDSPAIPQWLLSKEKPADIAEAYK